jgi:Flp pilus assembly pilin Flp
MQNLIKNFVNDQSGATAIVYGLIAAHMSINDKFQDVSATLDGVSETAGTVAEGGD